MQSIKEKIPSKLYDYFWARRPVLGLTRDNPQLDTLLREHGGWVVHSDDKDAVVQALEQLLERWQRNALADVAAAPVGVDNAVATILRAVDALDPGVASAS